MKRTKEKMSQRKSVKWVLAVLMVLAVCIGVRQDVSAQNVILEKTEITLYVGEQIQIAEFVSEHYREGVSYRFNSANPSPENVTLSVDGCLTAKAEGSVKIDVIYIQGEQAVTEILTVQILEPEELEVIYGESYTLKAASVFVWDEVQFTSEQDSVMMTGYGEIQICGFQDSEIYITKENGSRVTVARVKVRRPSMAKSVMARATGTKNYQPELRDFAALGTGEDLTGKVRETSVAEWTDTGITAKNVGTTELSLTITAKNGDKVTVTSTLIVTNPKLSVSRLIMASGTTRNISVSGTCAASETIWGTGTHGTAYFADKGKVYARSSGKETVTVVVDGKALTCIVIVSDPYYAGRGVTLYKGLVKKISIKGKVKGSSVKFTSKNKKVATVTKSGKVRGKKSGHARVIVTVDGRKITVWIEVGSKRGYRASRKAIAISKRKTKYSQARRMSRGYYDCSSLVSRVYREYGVYFGSKSGWSPVAADIGKWCKRNKKVLANKAVSYKKLLPGDLIFYSSGKNGRYRNITHVEMYVGQGMDVSASSSNNRVIHYGYYPSDSIVMIARSAK